MVSMRLRTFITFFFYQNIRSLPPYLSIPYSTSRSPSRP